MVQLCKHFGHKVPAEWGDHEGRIRFEVGEAALRAAPETLMMVASAPDPERLARLEAERQEREAKRVNDANQAAILRLMNELQTVAEGDLTVDIHGNQADETGQLLDAMGETNRRLAGLVLAEAVSIVLAQRVGRETAHHLLEQCCKRAVAEQRHRPDADQEEHDHRHQHLAQVLDLALGAQYHRLTGAEAGTDGRHAQYTINQFGHHRTEALADGRQQHLPFAHATIENRGNQGILIQFQIGQYLGDFQPGTKA